MPGGVVSIMLGDLCRSPQIGTVVLGTHTQSPQLRQSGFDHFGRGVAVQGDVHPSRQCFRRGKPSLQRSGDQRRFMAAMRCPSLVATTLPLLVAAPWDGILGEQARIEGTMALLDGKVGIITGAASGIGAATARVFAVKVRSGAGRHRRRGRFSLGRGIGRHLPASRRHRGGRLGRRHRGGGALGRLDIMVANAGIGITGSAIDMSLKEWRRQMAINVDGVFLSVKYCIPAMRRAGNGGSIVMLSSVRDCAGRSGWLVIAPPRERFGCSPNRWHWSAPRPATASG